MDIYGLVLVFLGTVAVCMGAYEIAKKTVVGRNTSASTSEQIRSFAVVDGVCYIAEGTVAILLAFAQQLPLLSGDVPKTVLVVLLAGIMIYNFVMAKKLLNNFPKEEKKK